MPFGAFTVAAAVITMLSASLYVARRRHDFALSICESAAFSVSTALLGERNMAFLPHALTLVLSCLLVWASPAIAKKKSRIPNRT